MDYPTSLQQVLPVPSPCPLGNSNQNFRGIPSPPPSPTEVVSPPLITYQCKTQQVGFTVPESSPRDSHSPPTNP